MLFILYFSLIRPILEARAEIQKYFCWYIFGTHEKFRICFRDYLTFKKQSRKNREEMLLKKSIQLVLISTHIGVFLLPNT